jgi:hypothetical protein
MLKWIPFTPETLPKENHEYIVCTKAGFYKIAELERWSDGDYKWSETQEQLVVDGVMYYAEINSPFD